MLELPEQDGEELCRALQRLYPTSCGESFDTLDQCAFAAEVMALGDVAECAVSHTVWAKDTSDSIMNGFYLGAVLALRKQRCHHSASNAENEVEGELVSRGGRGENRLEANTNEEDFWTLAEEHEDIHDDVVFVDVDWNENAAGFEQKYQLDGVLALDANDVAPNLHGGEGS